MNKSFAVFYRGYVLPEKEQEYIRHWKTVATYFVNERGALGSTLHKAEDGMWVAYSRWPDIETRDASWPADDERINPSFPSSIHQAILGIKSCLNPDHRFPEITLSVIEDIVK